MPSSPSSPPPLRFGTDGWRAVIADQFTFANVRRVAQAAADYWTAEPPPGAKQRVVIGYDRRFLSDAFARSAAEVTAANGFETILTPVSTPTPSVSFAVKALQAAGGVMMTASHNPAIFNGFKLKAFFGGPATDMLCRTVERHLDARPVRTIPFDEAVQAGRIRVEDVRPAHFAAIKKLVDFKLIARSKLRFAHDALFGVGAGCFDVLLKGTTCRVTTLNGAHDPLFGGINPEPVPQNYGPGSAYLKKHPHDICLVTDGDADRVGGMDGRGGLLTTHQVICCLLHHYLENRRARGRIVKAITTTSMTDKICAAYGLPMTETGVGFKFICEEMLKGGVMLGVEESGGIGFQNHIPERDGIAAGMMLLELLACEGRSVNQILRSLEKRFGPHHYGRLDLHYPLEKRDALVSRCQEHPPAKLLRSPVERMQTFDGVKYTARDTSWLMLRASGTEPVLRIYAEGRSAAEVSKLLEQGRKMTRMV